jgi:hypothetical protein
MGVFTDAIASGEGSGGTRSPKKAAARKKRRRAEAGLLEGILRTGLDTNGLPWRPNMTEERTSGRFGAISWSPTKSRYRCIYWNEKRWAVVFKGHKLRFSALADAERCFESICAEGRLDPADKLRPLYPGDDEAQRQRAALGVDIDTVHLRGERRRTTTMTGLPKSIARAIAAHAGTYGPGAPVTVSMFTGQSNAHGLFPGAAAMGIPEGLTSYPQSLSAGLSASLPGFASAFSPGYSMASVPMPSAASTGTGADDAMLLSEGAASGAGGETEGAGNGQHALSAATLSALSMGPAPTDSMLSGVPLLPSATEPKEGEHTWTTSSLFTSAKTLAADMSVIKRARSTTICAIARRFGGTGGGMDRPNNPNSHRNRRKRMAAAAGSVISADVANPEPQAVAAADEVARSLGQTPDASGQHSTAGSAAKGGRKRRSPWAGAAKNCDNAMNTFGTTEKHFPIASLFPQGIHGSALLSLPLAYGTWAQTQPTARAPGLTADDTGAKGVDAAANTATGSNAVGAGTNSIAELSRFLSPQASAAAAAAAAAAALQRMPPGVSAADMAAVIGSFGMNMAQMANINLQLGAGMVPFTSNAAVLGLGATGQRMSAGGNVQLPQGFVWPSAIPMPGIGTGTSGTVGFFASATAMKVPILASGVAAYPEHVDTSAQNITGSANPGAAPVSIAQAPHKDMALEASI